MWNFKRLMPLFLGLVALLGMAVPARSAEALPSTVTDVQLGAYILRITDVSQKDGTYNVDMWVWLRWHGDAMEPHKTIEIANGLIENKTETKVFDDQGYNYTQVRIQAKIPPIRFPPFSTRQPPNGDRHRGFDV
jgi:hypothetical protein